MQSVYHFVQSFIQQYIHVVVQSSYLLSFTQAPVYPPPGDQYSDGVSLHMERSPLLVSLPCLLGLLQQLLCHALHLYADNMTALSIILP